MVLEHKYELPVKMEDEYIESVPVLLWKVLYSMKAKESISMVVSDAVLREL